MPRLVRLQVPDQVPLGVRLGRDLGQRFLDPVLPDAAQAGIERHAHHVSPEALGDGHDPKAIGGAPGARGWAVSMWPGRRAASRGSGSISARISRLRSSSDASSPLACSAVTWRAGLVFLEPSKPVAITVTFTSSRMRSSMTVPKMM